MTDLRKAAENAIKVLEADAVYIEMMGGSGRFQREAQEDLRQALAQPEKTCCCDDPNVPEVKNHD
jgi:hypothetical protein